MRGTREKILVTQTAPDFDACVGLWLLKRFVYLERIADILFLPMGDSVSEEVHKKYEVIYVDMGGGIYDHHDTDEFVCAASLIMEDNDLASNEAIKLMVEYANKVDHGLIIQEKISDFDIVNLLEGLNIKYRDKPKKLFEVMEICLDGIYLSLEENIKAEEEFKKIKKFETPWGPGGAALTGNKKVRYLAHRRGFIVYIFVNPKKQYRGFTSPGGSGVDFTGLFELVKEIEPSADWFLHASKELLLCGSDKAPNKKLSKLRLADMILLIQKLE